MPMVGAGGDISNAPSAATFDRLCTSRLHERVALAPGRVGVGVGVGGDTRLPQEV